MSISKRVNSVFISDEFSFAEIDFELDSFIHFLELTNKQIEDNLKRYLNEYNNTEDIAKDHIFDAEEVYIKEKNLQLYYSSIIVSLYSFLEQSLLRLCEVAELNKKIKTADISGKGIFKFKRYLEKVVDIDFKEINDEWNEITKLNQLRNLFVHSSNSKLDKTESKRRINAIKEIPHINIVEYSGYYIIEFESDRSIRFFVKTIRTFLTKIFTLDN